jgi:hypothetical protein
MVEELLRNSSGIPLVTSALRRFHCRNRQLTKSVFNSSTVSQQNTSRPKSPEQTLSETLHAGEPYDAFRRQE